MILRRVIQHVKKQEWTAIGIDFCIVVIGVFVGIQVANWNQARVDARLGRTYVERLTVDLEKDLKSRRVLAAYFADVLASIERTDDLLSDSRSDQKALLVNAYRATEYNYTPQTRATWDEIVSSGNIGLLPAGVGVDVAEYYDFDSARVAIDTLAKSSYRHHVRKLIPLQQQKALRAGCSDVRSQSGDITGFKQDCDLKLEPGVIAATANQLRADLLVQAELRQQYSDIYSAKTNISFDAASVEKALSTIKKNRQSMESP